MFKTIAVILQTVEETGRLLDFVEPLAREWGAHLIGIHAEPLPVDYSSGLGFPDVGLIQAASEAAETRDNAVKAAFAERAGRTGLSHDWHSLRNFSGDSVFGGAAAARCADVVIVGQRDAKHGFGDGDSLDAMLFESGRPVLVVPHSGTAGGSFRKILVSWNGSREAARAAFDALPLIAASGTTEVFMVDPEDDSGEQDGATALAAALSRHGATVTVATTRSAGRHVDEVIRDRVTETGADLIVIGAYSHSWLRELLFGGVTRTVLQSMQVPTFMSR